MGIHYFINRWNFLVMKRKDRTKIQLLELFLKELKTRGVRTGLCALAIDLHQDRILTASESLLISLEIQKRRPIKTLRGYYYEQGALEPRIAFTERMLAEVRLQNKNEESCQ